MEIKPEDIVRKACIVSYNTTYTKFRRIFEMEEDDYAEAKFDQMKRDFSQWYCNLDSGFSRKFMEYVLQQED